MIDHDKHHRAAFVLRYDKSLGRLTPITRRLVVFEHGRGDAASFGVPYMRAGYIDAPDAITDAGRLGSVVGNDGAECIVLLSVGIANDLLPRVVPREEAIEHRGGIAVPWRRDHHATLTHEADSLGYAVMSESILFVLAPTDCVPETGNIAYIGAGALRSEMFVEAPRAMATVSTNRIALEWEKPFSVVVSPLGIDARDGDLVVLDLDVRVSFAAVRFSVDWTDYAGVTDTDREKIAAWRASNEQK